MFEKHAVLLVILWAVPFISLCEQIFGVISMNNNMLLCVKFVNICMLDMLT